MENFDYLKKVRGGKKKPITITIDESIVERLSAVADGLELNRNGIINDTLERFLEDFERFTNPNYFIINTNLSYMKNGHLHMLLGNRASAWDDTKQVIEGIKPGDYVFIYMNEKGIVGSGSVKAKFMQNDYCLVDTYEEDSEVWEEYFVAVEYEKKSLIFDTSKQEYKIDESSAIKASEFKNIIANKPLNRTKVTLKSEEGQQLRALYTKDSD